MDELVGILKVHKLVLNHEETNIKREKLLALQASIVKQRRKKMFP